eukprot:TRINITY_DN15568_c0_g1_i1.p1 TRINITY_DN15568_c0_g1~~TRINITY_DN15568_c0_g1_i1.p1  ORF type:complete len:322 (+),score=58.53 TRINITY_DN15568_c0_g1_i1:90-1055(+)
MLAVIVISVLILVAIVVKLRIVLFPSWVLREVSKLDPKTDFERILFLAGAYDLPADYELANTFGLVRTFAIESIGQLLDKTAQFKNCCQKRYDDTLLLMSFMLEYGPTSDKGSSALQRMNEIHSHYKISNDDYIFVLSTFILEPIRFSSRFSWRSYTTKEQEAMYWFYHHVGTRMGITDIPPDLASLEKWSDDYERAHLLRTDAGRHVLRDAVALFAGWCPRVMRPLVPVVVTAALAVVQPHLVSVFQLGTPNRVLMMLVRMVFYARAAVLRLLPRRSVKSPVHLTLRQSKHLSYAKCGVPDPRTHAHLYGPVGTAAKKMN